MFPDNNKLAQAAAFYAIALGLAIVIALCMTPIGRDALFLTMFAPLVAVIACRVLIPEGTPFRLSEIGLSRLGLRHWPFALLVPLVAILPGYLLVWTTGIADVAALPEDADVVRMAVRFAVSIVLGAALGALGEEVGWRGYLLPRLADALGTGKAGLLTGFLHGLWHLPLILLTPYYLADAPALVVVPLFLTLLTLSGPVFAHLRFASGSIVPVALMHHAWNGYWDTLSKNTLGDNKALVACLAGESGIASIVMMAAVCLWLARRGSVNRSLVAGGVGG